MILLSTRVLIVHSIRRHFHSKPKIYINNDETCFVAYHPEQRHDYKYTRPLPIKSDINEESPLKVTSRHMFTDAPNLEQLQALTYTPATYWRVFHGKAKRMRYKAAFDDKVDRKGVMS